MTLFDEIKQDAAQTGALLGAVLAFVLLFLLYSVGGIWIVGLLAVILGAGYVFVRYAYFR